MFEPFINTKNEFINIVNNIINNSALCLQWFINERFNDQVLNIGSVAYKLKDYRKLNPFLFCQATCKYRKLLIDPYS
ncbi:hypothetical protein DERF_014326 [Dermatophagoides farinae]|uniref:Uncharacterized protein n=1 Tax=Dermatophagoides farinae TaxID=6954 RepID=A0A922L165_DERFA|nr:hypothetical protein DERF_014326 [Dermatophagoides farinae]